MAKRKPPPENPQPDPSEPIWNVSRIVQPNAQFPMTAAGQLAKMEMQDHLDEQRVKRLIGEAMPVTELARIAAEAAAAATRAALEVMLEHLPGRASPSEPLPAQENKTHWTALKDEWDTYDGFRADMQQRQKQCGDQCTKADLASGIGCHPRTITRVMEHYHLPARLWPPSRWPARQPSAKPTQSKLPHMASLAAGIPSTWWVLDLLSDGRVDDIIRTACWIIRGTKYALM